MHSAIIIIESSSLQNPYWQNILGIAKTAKENNESIDQIGAGSWQIVLENGLHSLCQMEVEAKAANLKYRILFFEEAPKWLYSNPVK